MTLYLDIGNTNIKAVKDKGKTEAFPTVEASLQKILKKYKAEKKIVLSSVVPSMTKALKAELKKTQVSLLEIGYDSLHGLDLSARKIKNFGPDLICMMAAAHALYPDKEVTITSLGTATVFMVLDKNGRYQGGHFFPGIGEMEKTFGNWGMVAKQKFGIPKKQEPSADVEKAAMTGMFFAQVGGIERMKNFLRKQTKKKHLHLATGGWAEKIAKAEPSLFDEIVPDMVIKGMKVIEKKEQF